MTNRLILPLVEDVIAEYPNISFEEVKIIGVQHILETTHAMFRSLFKKGLKPENISVIGKCYSTNKEVFNEMINDGLDISKNSFLYSSHEEFDTLFSRAVERFISERIESIKKNIIKLIIVLDDGGKCLNIFNKNPDLNIPVIGIEQTTSGYDSIKNILLKFPVINVARSPIKLTYESPMIAHAASMRMIRTLNRLSCKPKKILILGGGAIGSAINKELGKYYSTQIYDTNNSRSHIIGKEIASFLFQYDCIIGCTGKTVIPKELHNKLYPGTSLISASSSDREFDAYYLRQTLLENKDCHSDLMVNNLLLVNSGFPVNFDGERENIDVEKIQLTIALITAAIIQCKTLKKPYKKSIIPLEKKLELLIQEKYVTFSC